VGRHAEGRARKKMLITSQGAVQLKIRWFRYVSKDILSDLCPALTDGQTRAGHCGHIPI